MPRGDARQRLPEADDDEHDAMVERARRVQQDKADVVWRYTKTQAEYLSRKDMIPKHIDVFSTG